jgi:hypothetical protein
MYGHVSRNEALLKGNEQFRQEVISAVREVIDAWTRLREHLLSLD